MIVGAGTAVLNLRFVVVVVALVSVAFSGGGVDVAAGVPPRDGFADVGNGEGVIDGAEESSPSSPSSKERRPRDVAVFLRFFGAGGFTLLILLVLLLNPRY